MASPERVLTGLLIAVAPPLLLLVGVILLARWLLPGTNPALIAGGLLALSAAWVTLLTVVYARVLRAELASLIRIAGRTPTESPAESPAGEPSPPDITARLSQTLAERDRQLAELASQVAQAPIDRQPAAVACHMVEVARRVTGDPTWSLALLASSASDLLAPGLYRPDPASGPEPVSELHTWTGVTLAERHRGGAGLIDGPWGAFLAVGLAAGERLRGVLLAPWAGRSSPNAADLALLTLMGQHAAIALDHALLFAQVRVQADSMDRMATAQRDFLRGVTHDLQTPLTSIRAAAAELRASRAVPPGASGDLDLIEHQADRLGRMVAQLLAMSRLDAGAIEPRQEVVNPRHVVERTWAALRAPDRRLDLELDPRPILFIADPDRLEQVLWAVLDNAVKYSPAGSPVRVWIGPLDGQTGAGLITVTDAGDGMDAKTAGRAFEQFFRAAEARRRVPDGSGIGLYTARGLVEAMSGSIRLESQPGHGTAVRIELPAEAVPSDAEEPAGDPTTTIGAAAPSA